MDYYDGNTVTGLWNYAQHFSLSDNSYDSVFGPSTPGALEPDQRARRTAPRRRRSPAGSVENGRRDRRSRTRPTMTARAPTTVQMSGKNIGDVLNDHHLTWGWFNGGFKPTTRANGPPARPSAALRPPNVGGASVADYSPHHEPFQYYASTANPHHLPPSAPSKIGQTDQANHQYDLTDFDTAVEEPEPAGRLLPQGTRLRGRSRRLLGSARRAALRDRHDQQARGVAAVVEHRGGARLRRLGRLVRPPDVADRQPLGRRRATR